MKEQKYIGIIIQARMGSSRLPGKMLMEFYNERSLMEIIIERIKQFEFQGKIILATTTNMKDDPLAELGKKMGVEVYRGDEENVLKRFIDAAEEFGVRKIIRVCADNPFIDGSSVKILIDLAGDADYCSLFIDDNTPTIKTHFGFYAEYVTVDALKKVQEFTSDKLYLEHVTNYIYTHPDKFKIKKELADPYITERSFIRLTIDTQNDFDLCKTIYAYFCNNGFTMSPLAIVGYIQNNKEYVAKMKNEIKANEK